MLESILSTRSAFTRAILEKIFEEQNMVHKQPQPDDVEPGKDGSRIFITNWHI